jgi:hypothetical protein
MKTHMAVMVVALVASACNMNPQIDSIAGELPLLDGDNRVGTIRGFNPDNPPETLDAMDAGWQEAIDAGMSVARLQIDWPELEPSPNTFDKAVLESRLDEMKSQGLQTFLLISAYDSGEAVVPADLLGKAFDDPEFIERFKNLMDWVIPMLVEYDGYLISISNEAENSFEEVPDLHKDILTFLLEVKKHVHEIDERMAVTVTFSEGSLDGNKPGIDELLEASDVIAWNFYGGDFQADGSPYYYPANSENAIKADVARLLNESGEKNIVIQELGMWSGNTHLDSSEEIQRKFFEVFFAEMQKHDRIKAAYNFQMVDWSPSTTQIFSDSLIAEGLDQDFIDQFAESLNTIGLMHYSDGAKKPAWDELIRWVDEFN